VASGSVADFGMITRSTGFSPGNSPVHIARLNIPYKIARIFDTVEVLSL